MVDQIVINREHTGFTTIFNEVIDCRILNAKEIALYIDLMHYADRSSLTAFPSHQRLADDLQISKTSIKNLIKALKAKGVISIQKRTQENGGTASNFYIINERPHQWNEKKSPESMSEVPPIQTLNSDENIFNSTKSDLLQINREHGGFTTIFNDVLSCRRLNATEIALFFNLMRYADRSSLTAFPSHQRLADDLQISKSTVKRTICSLEEKGVLMKRRRFREDGGPTSNLYFLNEQPHQWQDKKNSPESMSELPPFKTLDSDENIFNFNQNYSTEGHKGQDGQTEKYSLEWIKDHYYYFALIENVGLANADLLMEVLFASLNTNAKTTKIEDVDVPTNKVVETLLQLDLDDLENVIVDFINKEGRVKAPKYYIRSMLYNAKAKFAATIMNDLLQQL